MIRPSLSIIFLLIPLLVIADDPSSRLDGYTPIFSDHGNSSEIHQDAWDKPFNQISQVACHNCYEPEIFNHPLVESLNHIKAIELDIWDEAVFLLGGGSPGKWYVRHGIFSSYSISGLYGNHNNCNGDQFLEDCLTDIRQWSNSNPGHFPLTLFLDKKQSWSTPEEGRTPQDLFNLLDRKLGKKLYLPKEQAELNNLNNITPAQWIWPTANELRGRIIVVINGGNFINSSNYFPNITGNKTYNADIDQIQTFKDSSTAFAGPYVFHHDDFRRLPLQDSKNSAVFLNSNFSVAHPTLINNYFSKGKTHSRLLRLWKVDEQDFCSLLRLKVAYLAYYQFMDQKCRGYRIVPMGYAPEELVNGLSDD